MPHAFYLLPASVSLAWGPCQKIASAPPPSLPPGQVWFGVEIVLDWMLRSYRKLTAPGEPPGSCAGQAGAPSKGPAVPSHTQPRSARHSHLRVPSAPIVGACSDPTYSHPTHPPLKTPTPAPSRVRPAVGHLWLHHAVGPGGGHRWGGGDGHPLLCVGLCQGGRPMGHKGGRAQARQRSDKLPEVAEHGIS